MIHHHEDENQWEQIYTSKHGPRIGRRDNGLGTVGSWLQTTDGEVWKLRATDNKTHWEEPTTDEGWAPDQSHELHDALKRLTARQRFVIELRYGMRADGERYAIEDIAEMMGVTFQAVAKHEQAALERLKTLLRGAIGPDS